MIYRHIEQISDRSEERFGLGIGTRNVIGLVSSFFPALFVSSTWQGALRVVFVVGITGLGFVLSLMYHGLPLYQWPIHWARGRVSRIIYGRTITPDSLPGVAQGRMIIPLRHNGPIRLSRRVAQASTIRSTLTAFDVPTKPKDEALC